MKNKYITPQTEEIMFSTSGIIMTSGLNDYGDNNIYGAPELENDINAMAL